jgi:release factor glutamine methyltransferase
MVRRRTGGEPLAWITGTTRFCGLDVVVHPGVYVPRWQSEVLARAAAAHLPGHGTAVDLATGSGAVARFLGAERPGARVLATELDPVAARCAAANGVDVLLGDLDHPLPGALAGRVDVLCGVLPYVPSEALHLLPRDVVDHEPRVALDGGAGGLGVVARAVRAGRTWVAPGGWLVLEAGGDQFGPLLGMLESAGYRSLRVLDDPDGDPRAVEARRPPAPPGGDGG